MKIANENILKGKWKEIKGEMQRMWGDITGDEWDQAQGDSTKLAGLLQKKYGLKEEEANKKIEDVVEKYKH